MDADRNTHDDADAAPDGSCDFTETSEAGTLPHSARPESAALLAARWIIACVAGGGLLGGGLFALIQLNRTAAGEALQVMLVGVIVGGILLGLVGALVGLVIGSVRKTDAKEAATLGFLVGMVAAGVIFIYLAGLTLSEWGCLIGSGVGLLTAIGILCSGHAAEWARIGSSDGQ